MYTVPCDTVLKLYNINHCLLLGSLSFLDQGYQSSPTLHVRCHQIKVHCVLFMFNHCMVGFNEGRSAHGRICGVALLSYLPNVENLISNNLRGLGGGGWEM